MSEQYTQQSSPVRFKAEELGDDDLLITRLAGSEALSELFAYTLELIAPLDQPVAFEDVLGKSAAVSLEVPGGDTRFFHGICSRFAQGGRDDTFVTYRAELVPQVWLLTKRIQSRIFQHVSVPDILKKVFEGFDVAYQIQGTFQPRDYCVQYRESDFAFASRLMEEEGMYYYFRHTADGCEMVIANTPQGHDDIPEPTTLIYDEVVGGDRDEGRVTAWEKVQEVRSGQVTLWDHCFELPGKNLEADQKIQEVVAVGQVNHKLNLDGTDKLEQYDYPGGYAGRFDGISRGGAVQASELEKIFEDNRRTARLRIQAETAGAVSIKGASTCRQMTAGHAFTLDRHFDADGDYVLTRVAHTVTLNGDGYRSVAAPVEMGYTNSFECVPAALPFRPARATPKPTVKGTQTATVVGPAGHEIFTDKYGRVKVQFPWDREGKFDADSSCWVRVGTPWAGKNWGMVHIPRIGQEVIVDFLEGDPNQPIIVGSVYNADQEQPYGLPGNMTQSGTRTRSTPGGTTENYNEIKFEDKKGQELVSIHAEKDMLETIENNFTRSVGGGLKQGSDPKKVGKSTTTVYGDHKLTVQKGDLEVQVEAGKATVGVNNEIDVYSNTSFIYLTSPTEIKLRVGGSYIQILPNKITLNAEHIVIEGDTDIKAVSKVIDINGTDETKIHGKKVTADGKSEATYKSSAGPLTTTAATTATFGVGGQNVICNTGSTNVNAGGPVNIQGSVVKVNC